jgi:hypothetical protein
MSWKIGKYYKYNGDDATTMTTGGQTNGKSKNRMVTEGSIIILLNM